MRRMLTLMLLCCGYFAIAIPSSYRSLAGINRYWLTQEDRQQDWLPEYKERTAKEWIQLHLSLVEQTLRSRSVAMLSAEQQQHRAAALDHLHQYWLAGNFPQNEQYNYRTPIFIDAHDNFCAVGYLVKATGYEAVSRMIASRTNLAYVMDMQFPELDNWAASYGFTKEELAWIQPTYKPVHFAVPLAGGTNGVVKELAVSQDGEKLYVGGEFSRVGSGIAGINVAYVTEDGNEVATWHRMGEGINGTVNAIYEYQGKVFAGGRFNTAGRIDAENITYWENEAWHNAGCLDGTVKDLVVFQGALYACGDFGICAGEPEANFAKWDGAGWHPITGLSGEIRTMEVVGDRLFLGGDIQYRNNSVNAISWSPSSDPVFLPFGNSVVNPVNDFETFEGVIYAVGSCSNVAIGCPVFFSLKGNEWKSLSGPQPSGSELSVNSLLVEGGHMLMGGVFTSYSGMTELSNCVDKRSSTEPAPDKHFYVDDAIHKMILFKNSLIAGGSFLNGRNYNNEDIPVGGIARRVDKSPNAPAPVAEPFRIYPNPLASGQMLTIENRGQANRVSIYDIMGKIKFSMNLKEDKKELNLILPTLAPGLYLIKLESSYNAGRIQKLLLR